MEAPNALFSGRSFAFKLKYSQGNSNTESCNEILRPFVNQVEKIMLLHKAGISRQSILPKFRMKNNLRCIHIS